MRYTLFAPLLIASLSAAACSRSAAVEAPHVAARVQPVIYGADDRVESDGLPQVAWIASAVTRAVALVPAMPAPASDEDAGSADASVEHTASARFQLCAEERFGDQPSIADCSGVLVSNDLVLTAGHCFESDDTCDRYRYALGYTRAAGDAGVAEPRLRRCKELVIREVGQLADGSPIDYALIRLTRAVDVAGALAHEASVDAGDEVISLGFPEGLPLKIDPNGAVLKVDRTGFDLATDAYHGSSGSAVYDRDGTLVGLLISGQADLQWNADRQCQTSRVIADAGAGAAERAMSARVALSRACFRVPDLALCPRAADGGAATEEDPSTAEAPVDSGAQRPAHAPDKSMPAEPDETLDPIDAADAGAKATGRDPDAGRRTRRNAAPPRRADGGCSVTAGTATANSPLPFSGFVLCAWFRIRRGKRVAAT